MRILILGGGTVGRFIAKNMSELKNDVTVVERRADARGEIDQYDVRVVIGDALQASVLDSVGASTADVCFALASSDEVNLISGSVAKGLGARRVAARVNSFAYRDVEKFDYRRHFQIDRFLCQDYMTAMEIARRIREPGDTFVEHFAGGELEMQEVVVMNKSSLTNTKLRELQLPSDVRVGAITRDGSARIASANDEIQIGDCVTLLGAREKVDKLKKTLNPVRKPPPTVSVIGGGDIGYNVAKVLEQRGYRTKILERNEERCQYLASRFLGRVDVYHVDGRRRSKLEEYGVGKSDFVIACAGDDESNILACVESKEIGSPNLIAVIKHSDYANVVKNLCFSKGEDVRPYQINTVSPYELMRRQAEGFAHVGALLFQNSTLLSGSLQVAELEAQEDSPITRATLRELPAIKPSLIAAVIRNNETLIPNADFTFHPGDFAVAFADAIDLPNLVKLFETER